MLRRSSKIWGAIAEHSVHMGMCTASVRGRVRGRMPRGDRFREIDSEMATGGGGMFVSSHFRVRPNEVQSVLERHGLSFRESGEHCIVRECPLCGKPTYGRSDNMFKLYIRKDSGVFFCHRCGNKGSWFDLRKRLGEGKGTWGGGDVVVEDEKKSGGGGVSLEGHGDVDKVLEDPLGTSEAVASSGMLSWLTEDRGLSKGVLDEYGVREEKRWFWDDQVRKKREMQCVVFPMKNLEGEVVRAKVRARTDKSRQLLVPAGAQQWGLFGLDVALKQKVKSIVLTEGEFDAMAVWDATDGDFVGVSVPNGCRSLPPGVLPLLEGFERIILWMDDDGPGREAVDRMTEKIGRGRCVVVRGAFETSKDANDVLVNEGKEAVRKAIQDASPLGHEEILSFRDLQDQVFAEVRDPEAMAGTPIRTLPGLHQMLKGWRAGELTVFTGPTGAGKTTLLSQLSLDLAAQGLPTLWGSFEIKNTRLARRMLAQYAGSQAVNNARASMEHREALQDAFSQVPLYFLRFFGATDVADVIDAMEYASYAYDVSHVVLDNLQFMTGFSGAARKTDRWDAQEHALDQFRRFATDRNVHVTVVIHPRKEPDDAPLGLSSVFGTAKATQEADNVIVLQSSTADGKRIDVKKNRFDGQVGSAPLDFDPLNQLFVPRGDALSTTTPIAALPTPKSRRETIATNTDPTSWPQDDILTQ